VLSANALGVGVTHQQSAITAARRVRSNLFLRIGNRLLDAAERGRIIADIRWHVRHWKPTAGQPDLDRSVKTFRACLLYFFAESLRIFCAEPADYAAHRHVRACRQKLVIPKGSDDGALTTPRQGAWGKCGLVTCGRRPIHKLPMKKPAADFSARALTFVAMMALCQ
jgi:hypothetical protein